MVTLPDLVEALADQIRGELSVVTDLQLQIEPGFVLAPSEVCVDVYPSLAGTNDPQLAGFADEIGGDVITIRARITTAASYEAQRILMEMMDDQTDLSIVAAVATDRTLGGLANTIRLNFRSGFSLYPDLSGEANWLGCEWNYTAIKARS